MAALRLIQVPYDSGNRALRMGRGPFHFIENGAVEAAKEFVDDIESTVVEYQSDFPIEMEITFGLHREISRQVKASLDRGLFPLVLAGNCNSTVGALGGVGDPNVGLLWFDGHGDINTPDTTTSGFIDGMPVAIIIGDCWQALANSIPGFQALPERQVVLVGSRDLDSDELERLKKSSVGWVTTDSIRKLGVKAALTPLLDDWEGLISDVYVHVDMDVHDPSLAPTNSYQPIGGPSPEEVRDCIRSVSERFRIVGASITAFDPDCDRGDKGLKAGLSLISLLAELAGNQVPGS